MEVLVFTSQTCAPCKRVKPVLQKLQETHKFKMRLVDAIPENQGEFAAYNVRSVPTTVILADDLTVVGKIVGEVSEDGLVGQLTAAGLIK